MITGRDTLGSWEVLSESIELCDSVFSVSCLMTASEGEGVHLDVGNVKQWALEE